MALLLRTNLREAARSLSAARQRSLLALIGIAIGIGSVIAMVSVGEIVERQSLRQFAELGTDILLIHNLSPPGGPDGRSRATIALEEAAGLATVPAISGVAPYMVSPAQVLLAGEEDSRIALVGATRTLADLAGLHVEEGRFLSDLDGRQYYGVIGAGIAASMRRTGIERVVGETIRIDDHVYTVVGVLRSGLAGPREIRVDRAVFVPVGTAQRVFRDPDIRTVMARMVPGAHYLAAGTQVRDYFRRQSEDLVIHVESPKELIEKMQQQSRLFTLLLGMVGGISLLVGGIGVMNVMLVSVSQRRLEIGIRRAIGARRSHVQWQFLIESVVLVLLGGMLGIGLGAGATYAICQFAEWPYRVSTEAAGLALAVTAACGVLFGLYPARQASRLNPVAALRGR